MENADAVQDYALTTDELVRLRQRVAALDQELAHYKAASAFTAPSSAPVQVSENEAQNFLERVSITLASTLDYEATLRNVVKLTVPYLADWFSLDIDDRTVDATIRRVATAHANPHKETLAHRLLELYPYTPERLDRLKASLANGQTQFSPDVDEAALAQIARGPGHLQALLEMHLTSSMLVPLMARGQLIGAFTLGITESDRRYNHADRALAEELGRRVAMAIDNSLLYREAQLAIARQKEIDQLKDEFISIAGHELRTPLTVIKVYAQILTRKLARGQTQSPALIASTPIKPEPDTITALLEAQVLHAATLPPTENFAKELQMLAGVTHQIDRMTMLIDEMLDISRIHSGQLELQIDPAQDIVQLLHEVVKQQQTILEERVLVFQSSSETLLANYDAARIEQVLVNLIGNAAKYSQATAPITVGLAVVSEATSSPSDEEAGGQLEIKPPPAMLVVKVADKGIGIGIEQQAHLFERFYRVHDSSANRIEGLGLGLYISYEIIRRHGGRMWVESEVGTGSTFYFSLPLEPPA